MNAFGWRNWHCLNHELNWVRLWIRIFFSNPNRSLQQCYFLFVFILSLNIAPCTMIHIFLVFRFVRPMILAMVYVSNINTKHIHFEWEKWKLFVFFYYLKLGFGELYGGCYLHSITNLYWYSNGKWHLFVGPSLLSVYRFGYRKCHWSAFKMNIKIKFQKTVILHDDYK